MSKTKIEWATDVWNPVTGCSKISIGCENCYAERMAKRLVGRFGYPADDPFRVTLHPDRAEDPLHWKKPRMVFVCSMSDLFHPAVPFEFIGKIFATAIATDWHTFQFLTKRPKRMQEFVAWFEKRTALSMSYFRHIWLGVTAENQDCADERIPILVRISAAVHFVSCEPMLGSINLRRIPMVVGRLGKDIIGIVNALAAGGIDWVIAGCESGPNRRLAKIEWFRTIRDECEEADVPFFLKQMDQGGHIVHMPLLDGQLWDQVPEMGRSAGMPKRLSRHSQQIPI